MKRGGFSLALVFLALLSAVSGLAAEPTAATGEDLFKWGEYDSLIRVLEPATKNGTLSEIKTAADSSARARSLMFLGVAFYATGAHEAADKVFQQSCALDPMVKLDRFYVTEEIANHFQAIAMDGIRRRQSRDAVAATASALSDRSPAPAPGENGRRLSQAPASRSQRREFKDGSRKIWVWWGLGVTAVVAAGGGAMYLANQGGAPVEHVTTIEVGK